MCDCMSATPCPVLSLPHGGCVHRASLAERDSALTCTLPVRSVYELYCDYVLKNPFHEMDQVGRRRRKHSRAAGQGVPGGSAALLAARAQRDPPLQCLFIR